MQKSDIPRLDVFIDFIPDPDRIDDLVRRWGLRSYTDVIDQQIAVPRHGLGIIAGRGEESSGRIYGVGAVHRGSRTATWVRRYRMTNIYILQNPISVEELQEHVDNIGAIPQFMQRENFPSRLASTRDLVVALLAARPELEATIQSMTFYTGRPGSDDDPGLSTEEAAAYQDDAGNLSMRLLGFSLDQMRQSTPRRERSLEDHLMGVDREWFDGVRSEFGELPQFRVFDHPKGRLTVIDSNRHLGERVLGVDLIYCCPWNRSFLLVQYKKMRSKRGRSFYYSDEQFDKEIDRMRGVPVSSSDDADTPEDYRLNSDGCYFKFVTGDDWVNREPKQLLPGMYLPLSLMEILLESPKHVTEYGRLRLHGRPDPNTRYLNNTQFTDLFEAGWIGSTGLTSQHLDAQLRATYELGHSLVFSIAEYHMQGG